MRASLLILLLAAAPGLRAQSFKPLETVPSGTVPSGINFQGRLEEQGVLVTGQRPVQFHLYDALTGGNLLWDSGQTTVTLADGVFGTVLSIPTQALISSGDKFLETIVDGISLVPREPLRSVPYARVAETVQGTVEISSGGLSVSNQSGVILFVSSITGQAGVGSSVFPSHPDTKLSVTGGDLTLGNASMSPATGAPDLFIPGNLSVEGSFVGGPAAGNSFQTVSVSTSLNAGELFKVGAALFAVPEAGRVGVGVLSPGADLHLQAGTVPGLVLDHATEPFLELRRAGTAVLRARHDGSIGRLGTANATDLRLETGGTERLTVEAGGEVGVGLTNPSFPLDVSGSANVSGALTVGTPLAAAEGGTGAGSAAAARTGLGLLAQDGSNVSAGFPLFAVRSSSVAAQAAAFESDPADCSTPDFFPRGFDEAGTVQSCTDVAGSLDLTEATNEARIYDNDNVLSGPWSVAASGANDVSFDSNRLYIDVDLNRVGIGLSNPSSPLDASGTLNATGFTEGASNTLTNAISGDAATATSLAGNGSNCAAGSAPLGADASLAAEGCFSVGDQAGLNGHTSLTSTHSATAANTPSRIVLRDPSGDFAAGTISAGLSGNASSMSAFSADPADCLAGEDMRGIGAGGAATGCTADAVRTEADAEARFYDNDNTLAGPWTVAASGTNDISLDSGVLVVDVSAGRVGVNTAAPGAELDVNGAAQAVSASLSSTGGNGPNNCVTRQTILGAGALFASQTCSAGEILLGGGGACVLGNLTASRPVSITEWRIDCDGAGLHEVYARCCRQ